MEIKKVLICGLGALGTTYASKLKNLCELKILADRKRINKYKNTPPTLNNKPLDLCYITPEEKWKADLIIISTKNSGLNEAIDFIKNFVSKDTIIISLINGISSEEQIASVYSWEKVVRSYYIGHSAIRKENEVSQDGIGKIVIEKNAALENFFSKNNIDYEISPDIIYSQWVKLGVNIILNQLSAIYETTVGELRRKKEYKPLSEKLISEILTIAKQCNVKNLESYQKDVISSIELVSDSGITSMYQDITSRRKTEVDIFSGEIIRLGKIYNILTPQNQQIYDKIKEKEEVL